MDERVGSQFENILGSVIHSDDDRGSIRDILKFFSIIFVLIALMTVVMTADIIPGDLYYRLVVYGIVISVEANFFVIIAYYGSLSDVTRSNPVIFENGLLAPPENAGDAYRGIWKPYMASKIVGIYPVFVIRERRKDNENYLEFRRLLIKFMDDRVIDVRTSLDGEMIKALDRMFDGKLKEHIRSSNEFFNFNSFNSEKVDELFRRSEPMLKHWKSGRYNVFVGIVFIIGFSMVFIFPGVLTMVFSLNEAFYLILVLPAIIIFFFIPMMHFTSSMDTATEQVIVLLHLIEYDDSNKAGLIPHKYQEQAELVKRKFEKMRRLDLEIPARLKGLYYPPPARSAHSKRLSRVSKEVVDVAGGRIVYYENKVYNDVRFISKYSLFTAPILLIIGLIARYLYDFEIVLQACCGILFVTGIVTAAGFPFLFYSKVGFSKNDMHLVKKAYSFTGSNVRTIRFEDIIKVDTRKKGNNIGAEQVTLKNNETVMLSGMDDILQIETYQRYERYKRSRTDRIGLEPDGP